MSLAPAGAARTGGLLTSRTTYQATIRNPRRNRRHEGRYGLNRNALSYLIAGARNHLQANYRSVAFSFEIQA